MKQTPRQRKALRLATAKKGWQTRRATARIEAWGDAYIATFGTVAAHERAQSLASHLNSENLKPRPERYPNPWPRITAWIRKLVGRTKEKTHA